MKKILIILLCVTMAVFLIGCKATPDNPVVIGKGDGQLEEKIVAQTDAPLPTDIPETGERIRETYHHDSLDITIEVDAIVDTQDSKSMPAVKVSPHKFTQEEVDRVYDYYVGDSHFFRIPDGEPWVFLAEQRVKDNEVRFEYAKLNDCDSDYLERLQNNVNTSRQEYLVAKDSSEFPAVTHELSKENLVFGGDLTEGIYGYFEKEDTAYRLKVVNDENGMSSEISLQRFRKDEKEEYIYEEMMGVRQDITYLGVGESLRELAYDDAFKMAYDTVSAFGAKSMVLAHQEAKQYPDDTLESYYTFVFTHQVDGVPCLYNAIAIANDEGYSDIWDYEKLIVKVDAHGVKYAVWCSPCDITEQLSKSAELISFEEVMNCFSKMVFIKNSYFENELGMGVGVTDDGGAACGGGAVDIQWTVESLNVYIDRIILGLMRVQSGKEYLLIPVWNFYGYHEALTADGEDVRKLAWEKSNQSSMGPYTISEYNLLIINAIDGSVIDLEQGY